MALTPQTFQNLERDIEDTGKAVNIKAIISPRYGDPFKSLPMISQEAENRGGFISAPTLAALQAIMPSYNWQLARDDSTGNEYRWNPAAVPTPQWEPTGKNYLHDAADYTDKKTNEIASSLTLKKADDPNIICLLSDGAGYALIYYDKVRDCFVGAGLLESVFGLIKALKKYEDSRYIPGGLDSEGRILWGWDKVTDRFFCGENFGGQQQQTKAYKYFAQKPIAVEINHMLSYGESLSVGATAQTILSTTQPYKNITFSKGPRLDPLGSGETLSVVPLVEQYNSPASDGGSNRGETHCSGAANYASLELLRNGVSPKDHVIFASTAGYGGAKISDLAKGGAIYPRVLNHINKARELNAGKTHKAIFTPFIIGTNDAYYATSYFNFKNTFQQVYQDFNADVKDLTGQEEDVLFAIVQISYGVRSQPQISKALWDLPQENDKFLFVTPTYHLPYSEGTHLTNVGYKLLGAYYGRVYAQYFIEGRYPDYVKPLSAIVEGDKVVVKFDVPTMPLQIDRTLLAQTTDDGFRVVELDENGLIKIDPSGNEISIPIIDVAAYLDSVSIRLASVPSGQILVRYAMDYLGSGLNILNGASGNLRDSTPDTIDIDGQEKILFHPAPHFELIANIEKGI
ncbi:TPA: sialate O-acetylesterase [Acinetobacter baumannii]